jgi:hypothetical protein
VVAMKKKKAPVATNLKRKEKKRKGRYIKHTKKNG